MSSVVKHRKFSFVEFVGANNNKFWNITEYDDGEILVEFGRIGKTAQSKLHPPYAKKFNTLIKSKIRKGYTENKVIASVGKDRGSHVSINKSDLHSIAKKQIKSNSTVVEKLIEKLVRVNIHNILSASSGNITYDSSTAQFKTPQGVIVPEQVQEARDLLDDLAEMVNLKDWTDPDFSRKLNSYLRLIPHSVGMRRINPRDILPNIAKVRQENDLLDGLDASFIDIKNSAVKQPKGKKKIEKTIFDVELIHVKDYKTIKWIKDKFHKTKNTRHHMNCSGLDVKNVYTVSIKNMSTSFDKYGKKLANIKKLWHGTKVSNVLSILKQGLIIPPSSSSHCTGRMYGNGLYFSSISTKALNYATGFWGRGGSTSAYFMFLADVAMGKPYIAGGGGWGDYPQRGYNSTWAKGGQSGVINDEMIVYRLDQANLSYLVEFSK